MNWRIRHILATLSVGALGLLGPAAYAQPWYESYTGWEVSTEPVLPSEERHPSIWFSADDLDALRAKRDADSYTQGLWLTIQQEIAEYRGMSIDETTMNTRPIMAKTLAFAWVMDQDEDVLGQAIDVLSTAYDNVPREVPKDGEHRLIYRATWLQNYLAAYDWLQPELTPEQDESIRARLTEEAQLIRDNLVEGIVYAPRPHNHRSKPAYALASAAVTLSDHPGAADWLEHALEQSNTVTRYQFSSDGIYREGGHYHVYNMVNLVPFLWHYLNVSGVDLFDEFAPGFEWPIEIRMHRGTMPNIEDSYIKPMPTHMVAAAYQNRDTHLHSSAPLAELLQWNFMSMSPWPEDYSGATNDVIWEIDELITYDPSIPLTAPDVYPTRLVESGQVAFRNVWEADAEEGRYLLFHGVPAADNHNHSDNLSYVLEARDAMLAVDAGYGSSGFSDPLRDWYTSPEAHNIVTVNGAAPGDFDFNVGPRLTHFFTSDAYDFAEMEARLPFRSGNTMRRGIAFPNQSYWVVYDLMYADGDVDYNLNVHGRTTRSRDIQQDGNRITWTSPATFGPSARLHTMLLASEPELEIAIERGGTSLSRGHAEPQYYARAYQRADTAAFLHLLYPSAASEESPDVSDVSADGALAFELTEADRVSLFAAQPTNRAVTIGRLTTDAVFAWAERTGDQIGSIAITRGREVSWDGRAVLETDVPLTLSMTLENGVPQTFTLDDLDGPVEFVLHARGGASIDEVTGKDGPVHFDVLDEGAVRIRLEEGGTYRVVTSVGAEKPEGVSGELQIELYPNPSTDRAFVRYEVPEPAPVTVRIYNMLGQLVTTLADGYHAAGVYQREWQGGKHTTGHVPSGSYIVELQTGRSRLHALMVRSR